VDVIEEMPGPRFFAYCYRLTAYQGVIANAWRRQQTKRAERAAAPPLSLAEWAEANPAAMEAAHERMSGGR
jgi:hypothetical protein